MADKTHIQELCEARDIEDRFVFSVLGSAIGKLIDLDCSDADILSTCHYLLDTIRNAQLSPAIVAAFETVEAELNATSGAS